MRKSNFALRLQPSLLDEARKIADAEGVALNQLINGAVAEKVSALRSDAFFRERVRRANIPEAIEILRRLGEGNPPSKGDELTDSEKAAASAPVARNRARTRKARTTPR